MTLSTSHDHVVWRPVCLLALISLATATGAADLRPADFLIRGGTVYTGAESPATVRDVVVAGDKIVYVGLDAQRRYAARQTIDANGKIVAPGFIDGHAHPDAFVRSDDRRERRNVPWLTQGVTTLLIGVDGGGTPEVAKVRADFERRGVGTNLVPYVGFSAIRQGVLGEAARAPKPAELDRMRALVAKGMCEGAVGLSAGLFYAPQSFAKTEEIITLAKEAARRGGIYDTHQRDESSYTIGLLESVNEVLRIGREAGIPVHFAHLKTLGVDVHGQAPQVIALINAARAAGQKVSADQYPWDASGTSLELSLLPRWAQDGGRLATLRRLADAQQLEKIRVDMRENLRRRGGPDSLLFNSLGVPWSGKTLAQISKTWKVDPIEAALRIIRGRPSSSSVVSFNMIESDIRLFMQQPWVVTSSDGMGGHPREYASFPRKYAKYVKEDKVISVGEFVRSSTGRAADVYRLDRRGYIKEGYFADIVVFDPQTYAPKADYLHPRELSEGVVELLVNGRRAIRQGKVTDELAGRVVLRVPPAWTCQK